MTDSQIIAELEEKIKELEEKLERKERQFKNLEEMYYSTISIFEKTRFQAK
ncbi:MAG: hypothetical protein J6M60_04315 [Clostridia bacterium]|nr:hypothetical protein [Clostridia bacterium]